jgi:hypothetical protein
VSALRELQFGFANAVFDESLAEAFSRYIRSDGLSGARRLRIYRNNYLANSGEALAAVYPATLRLIGADFFRQAAGRYAREVRSTSGDIRRYGGSFPDFLASLEDLANFPYLRDVARLEWAWHRAFHSESANPLDLLALRNIAPEDYPALRFRLQPAARLLASDYPILRIWQVNLEEWQGDQTVDLGEGGVNLLILRRENSVTVETLPPADYRLLESLNLGDRLAKAIADGLAAEPDFDFGGALARFVSRGVLVGFSTDACAESPASSHQYSEV